MAGVVVRPACPACGGLETPAVRTTVIAAGKRWLVHRRCAGCGHRFKVMEVAPGEVEEVRLKAVEASAGVRPRVRVRRL
jgi:transcriptional regulator NrdR family protein